MATTCLVCTAAGSALAQDARLVQGDDPYFKQAQGQLQQVLTQQNNTNRAKNVILVVGDGLGFSTVTAARIFEGQQRGVDGESNVLSWEAFPHLAAAKTYSADAQITDSAPSAVAMTAGVKTINDVMGLDHTAKLDSCEDQKSKTVTTLWEMAETIGMSTGAVTTATITHATPGATYAHIANRDWESDAAMTPEAIAQGCADIARQLVEMKFGDGLEVALGGGRANFLPTTAADPEDEGKKGKRKDGKDLTQAWLSRYGNSGAFVWNKEQFDKLDPDNVDHVLGLFEMSHMEYDYDRPKDKAGEPSLAEMTDKAIDMLSKNPEGYVLLVEGGRVDHGSHAGNAYRTMTDAVALNEAVKTIMRKVDLNETLVVVTGDHSHTLTIAGYAKRGNPILGVSVGVDNEPILGMDGKPYTTVSFANGPGGQKGGQERRMLTMEEATDPDFIQQTLVPMQSETHGGEDLGIYAIGPWSHLFQGTVEENYTFHVMDFASKISERASQRADAP
ncbi:MAG TPA: alkaline phosphatase [Geminicoccus sp.]|nr:alkaline phosphatase [Geminicoccus sp.]HEX2527573.1 alkaline phosphatase [Geminicoccus sp.]